MSQHSPQEEDHSQKADGPPWQRGPRWGHGPRQGNGPPWRRGRWNHGPRWRDWEKAHTAGERQMWRRKGRAMFFRFTLIFGFMVFFVMAGMGMLAWLLTRWVGGTGSTAVLVWILGLGLAVTFPAIAIGMAIRAFRGITSPLVDVMSAAEAVAQGDLSVRVSEHHGGEFGRLAQTFNRMVEELALADQRRRNLTADVAHELRTPLHIIQGNLEGVLDEVYEPTAEHIGATLDETRLLARLVEDLRTLSLAESGQLPLQLETVSVKELLEDVETSFSGQADAADIALTLEKEAGLTVEGDYGRLTQVLNNLVINALRHTPAGGRIALTARRNGAGVSISVEDSGSGIAAEDLPYIFDRFWRGDRARPHTGGATGLGLAISQQLVRAHQGTLEVESQLGAGSKFTLDLPGHSK